MRTGILFWSPLNFQCLGQLLSMWLSASQEMCIFCFMVEKKTSSSSLDLSHIPSAFLAPTMWASPILSEVIMYGQFATPEQEAKAMAAWHRWGSMSPSQLLYWSLSGWLRFCLNHTPHPPRHCLWPFPGRGSHVVLASGLVATEDLQVAMSEITSVYLSEGWIGARSGNPPFMADTESQKGTDGWEVNKTSPEAGRWASTHCSTEVTQQEQRNSELAPARLIKTTAGLVCGLRWLLNFNSNKTLIKLMELVDPFLFLSLEFSPQLWWGKGLVSHMYVQEKFPQEAESWGPASLNCGSPNIQDALRIGEVPSSQSGEGNGNPLQYSCLENPMDREARLARVPGDTRVGHNLATKPPPPSPPLVRNPSQSPQNSVDPCAYFPWIKALKHISQAPSRISHSEILGCFFLRAISSPKMLPLPGMLSCPIPFLLVEI